MRVLVLGGTGLISTPMVELLLKAGHEPVLFNRGESPSRSNADIETVHGDRNDFKGFEAAVADIKPDAVIDMLTFDSHTAANSVSVFKDTSVQHYLFCSATSVYGPLSKIPADESEPHTPTGQYGENKSEAEHVFIEVLKAHQFPVTILRPAHVYGPGQTLPSPWGYDACLVSRIRTDKAILVPGDGYGAFQLLYSEDAAAAFVAALGEKTTLGQVYNVAPETYLDWQGYLTALGTALDTSVNLIPAPSSLLIAGSPPDASILLEEIYQFPMAYDSSRFRAHVPNWIAKTPLDHGFQRTLDWLAKTNAHMDPDEQPWIDMLADKLLDFEKDLALSEFAFDEKIFGDD